MLASLASSDEPVELKEKRPSGETKQAFTAKDLRAKLATLVWLFLFLFFLRLGGQPTNLTQPPSSTSEETRVKTTVLGCLAFAVVTIACSDATAPRNRGLQVPQRVNQTVGPPAAVTFSINSLPGVSVALTNFPYDTWVALEATGMVSFTSLPPAPGASSYYQYPGSSVDARGVYDFRINDPSNCALRLFVFGPAINNSSFGDCRTGGLKTDTTKFVGAATLKRGLSPYQYSYDCDPWGSATCHTIADANQSVTLRVIPVTLNKPTPSKRVWNFAASQGDIIFTASRTPDSLTIGGGRTPMPVKMTLWQWIGADSTRLPITGYCGNGAFPSCHFYPRESGRMVTKAFTGGWEQTTTATVACLVNGGDAALDDSTSDFQLRETLLDQLDRGLSDSSSTAGWDASNPKGWRHETGTVIWRLQNGGFMTVPVDDPDGDACHLNFGGSIDPQNPPVPGATIYGISHAHVTPAGQELFCKGSVKKNGKTVKYAERPNDTTNAARQRRWAGAQDSTNGGSRADWNLVYSMGKPDFVVEKNGMVHRLGIPDVYIPFLPRNQKVYVASNGKTEADRRCAWVKKYKP